MRRRTALLSLLALPLANGQANGYVAQFTTRAQLMGTKTQLLDASNVEIAKLSAGFTISLWARFPDLSNYVMPTVQILLLTDGNFMQPFAGTHGGYEFTSGAVGTVSTLGDAARNWHHYAMSWDSSSGARKHYIDGVLISTTKKTNYGSTWFTKANGDNNAFIILGQGCYPQYYETGTAYTSCNPNFQFEGEMDDVAIFATALTDAEITARWDQSLTDRLGSSLEPTLIFFCAPWPLHRPSHMLALVLVLASPESLGRPTLRQGISTIPSPRRAKYPTLGPRGATTT